MTDKPIPLSETTKTIIDKLRPKKGFYTPTELNIPKGLVWRDRRFFVARGHFKNTIIWVDDEDSCPTRHGGSEDWHSFAATDGHAYAIRCPGSLTNDQKMRLERDVPYGTAHARLASVNAERGRQVTKRAETASDLE